MGFDATFKRYFAAVVCLLVAIAAYFQAAGLGQLVVSSLALDPSSTPVVGPGMRPVAAAPPAAPEHATNADAILGRNPFDSVTGPLDGKPIDPLPAPTSNPEDLTRDPYEDPFCDTAKAMLIVTSDDPEWSFASLAGPDGKTQLRRKGDEINGQTVFFVGDLRPDERRQTDRRDLWDRVWLTSGGSRCQLAVGGKAPAKSAAPKAAEKDDKPKAGKGKVPAEISSKIHKISDNEFNVERGVIDAIIDNQAELMKSARIVPEKEGDKVVGIRLFGVRSESLLSMLGLENSDRLSAINGFELSDPQKALEAYAKLRTADHLTLAINRRGKPMNIDFNIK